MLINLQSLLLPLNIFVAPWEPFTRDSTPTVTPETSVMSKDRHTVLLIYPLQLLPEEVSWHQIAFSQQRHFSQFAVVCPPIAWSSQQEGLVC